MGNTKNADGSLVISATPTGTRADMQAIADRAEEIGGLLKLTSTQRAQLTSSQTQLGWVVSETDTGILWLRRPSGLVPIAGATPAVRLSRAGAHSSGSPFQTNGGTFRLNWDREDEDPFDMHTNGFPERITIPQGWGGIWSYSAKTRVEDNGTEECLFFLDKNGIKVDSTELALQGGFYKRGFPAPGELRLQAGDWVAFAVNKTGAAANLTPSQSFFGLRWERP